ncbi:MAG TPA: helix-turn-helix domain-containing protein [Amycolatopsis sp.]|uniref:MarR family winged helix-turn-helix transcriptional regulator n=1 Tax=Amycolatopsis sp. TaxID=37632 RepID=UPI002B4A7627|nr:helix-turn-helix domain-containing protein [Amycolatopsis sp.]HKS43624.1 helix-turn-helix domain-containing protein [Amycolatopsis sp.]
MTDVDGGELHRLGRRLIELSRGATGQAGDPPMTPGELAVLEDVLKHPGTSLTEIRARTGFVQSHVSTSVARLRERGSVETAPDPDDGRRVRVHVPERILRVIKRRSARRIDAAIAEAVGDERAERVEALLAELAKLLLE